MAQKVGKKEIFFSRNAIARNISGEAYHRERTKSDDTIVWTDLDHATADVIFDMHKRSDTTAVQCRRYMLNFLGKELMFKQSSGPIYPKGNFKQIVDKEWSKFIVDAYDWIFTTGLCPVEFRRSTIDEIEFVPRVLDFHSVRIQLAYIIEIDDYVYRILRPSRRFLNIEESTTIGDDYQQQSASRYQAAFSGMSATFMDHFDIFAYGNTLQKSGFHYMNKKYGSAGGDLMKSEIPGGWVLDQCAIVLRGFGWDPNMFGHLTTPLQSVLDLRDMTSLHSTFMTKNQMDSLAAPIFIQNMEQPDQQSLRDSISFESAANKHKDTKRLEEERRLQALSVLSAAYYGEMQEFFLNTVEGVHGEMRNRIAGSNTLSSIFTKDRVPPVQVLPLPPGYVLPAGQKKDVTLGQRFFDLDDTKRSDICSSYGIPRDLLQNSGTHSQNTAVQAEFLQKTIMSWADIFKQLLTFLYNSIYGQTDSHYRITSILERKQIASDMAARIEEDIIEEWNETGGNMTRRQIEDEQNIIDVNLDEDSEQESEKRPNKRSREESSDTVEKKQNRPHPFDYDIQSKVNNNMTENKKGGINPLEHSSENKPVEVSLALKSASSIDLLTFEYMQGAITDDEYWIAMRQQIGYSADDKNLKELHKQKKERELLEQKPAAGSKPGASSSSKSGGGSKKPAKKPSASSSGVDKSFLKDMTKKVTKSVMSSLMEDSLKSATSSGAEGRGRKKDGEKERKDKIKAGNVKASESNTKRSMSSHHKQTSNAKSGKKNKEKKG
jgi:hypothetical protein